MWDKEAEVGRKIVNTVKLDTPRDSALSMAKHAVDVGRQPFQTSMHINARSETTKEW